MLMRKLFLSVRSTGYQGFYPSKRRFLSFQANRDLKQFHSKGVIGPVGNTTRAESESESEMMEQESEQWITNWPATRVRYTCSVAYQGDAFYGSARGGPCGLNSKKMSVQSCLEGILSKLSDGRPVTVVMAGRTDSGVHALAQQLHFDLERFRDNDHKPLPPLSAATLERFLNNSIVTHPSLPPHSLLILSTRAVSPAFHARYSAESRSYLYRIVTGGQLLFERGRAWQLREHLDIEKMRVAAQILEGQHDFSAFRSSDCQAKSPIRVLKPIVFSMTSPSSSLSQDPASPLPFPYPSLPSSPSIRLLTLTFTSRSFLMRQVRNLVGTLVQVGLGKMTIEDVRRLIETGSRREENPAPAAPACGLYLAQVEYSPEAIKQWDSDGTGERKEREPRRREKAETSYSTSASTSTGIGMEINFAIK